jgi:hypothetical protein
MVPPGQGQIFWLIRSAIEGIFVNGLEPSDRVRKELGQ